MFDEQAVIKNYRDRIKRLALFEPLFGLQSRRMKDAEDRPVDLFELGILTLLFFFEHKLNRSHHAGVEELAVFLSGRLEGRYRFDHKGYLSLAREMIGTFRPASGRRLSKTFYDYEQGKEDTFYYSILKAGLSHIEQNKQYYELDEDGLELVFSTNEYYAEYQISISQMLLRKQLEKGEFMSALRQIEEMRLNVASLNDRMNRLGVEINRNITSDEVLKKYQELITDINRRLEVEDVEFESLATFVQETVVRLENNLRSDRDREVFRQAMRVSRELGGVHRQHNELLGESIKLKRNTLVAAKESLYYLGVESFNFNRELMARVISEPLPVDTLRTLSKPFLMLEHTVIWSPLSVFFPQRVMNRDESEFTGAYAQVDGHKEEEANRMAALYGKLMSLCLEETDASGRLRLSDLVDRLEQRQDPILTTRYFYDFWMVLHQFSPISVADGEGESSHLVLKEALELLEGRYREIRVLETDRTLWAADRFEINDLNMILEVNDDVS